MPLPQFPSKAWRAALPHYFFLLLAGAIVAWPLVRGGALAYLDNPAHIVEALALARGQTWSEDAFCGFPLGELHSPLFYGAIAILIRVGVPAAIAYSAFSWLGFVFPALAIRYVAARRLPPVTATILGLALILERDAIVDISSALGGMWAFHASGGLFVLLLDRLGRRTRRISDFGAIATLVGLVGLTHTFAILAIVFLFAAAAFVALPRGRIALRNVTGDAIAAIVGAIASATYWLPIALHLAPSAVLATNRSATEIARALLLGPEPFATPLTALGASGLLLAYVPQIAIVLGGLWGLARLRGAADHAPRLAAIFALALLFVLAVILPGTEITALGPLAWRLTYFVRLALVVLAIRRCEVGNPFTSFEFPRAAGVVAAFALFAAYLAGAPLRNAVAAETAAMPEVFGLWQFLRTQDKRSWGRVFVEDTYHHDPEDTDGTDPLSTSHVLARTGAETGARIVGAYYASVPFRTAPWTWSEYALLFGLPVTTHADVDRLAPGIEASNTTHFVASRPETLRVLDLREDLEKIYASTHFGVYAIRNARSRWTFARSDAIAAQVESYDPGAIVLAVDSAHGGELGIKVAYHPDWQVAGADGVTTAPTIRGLLVLKNIPAGPHHLEIAYRPSKLPTAISLAGWVIVLVGLLLARTRKASSSQS